MPPPPHVGSSNRFRADFSAHKHFHVFRGPYTQTGQREKISLALIVVRLDKRQCTRVVDPLKCGYGKRKAIDACFRLHLNSTAELY